MHFSWSHFVAVVLLLLLLLLLLVFLCITWAVSSLLRITVTNVTTCTEHSNTRQCLQRWLRKRHVLHSKINSTTYVWRKTQIHTCKYAKFNCTRANAQVTYTEWTKKKKPTLLSRMFCVCVCVCLCGVVFFWFNKFSTVFECKVTELSDSQDFGTDMVVAVCSGCSKPPTPWPEMEQLPTAE